MHFNFHYTVALTGLTAPAFDVKAKAPWIIATRARLRRAGEQFANRREQPRIRRGITARRATDRALIDADDFVKVLEPGQA